MGRRPVPARRKSGSVAAQLGLVQSRDALPDEPFDDLSVDVDGGGGPPAAAAAPPTTDSPAQGTPTRRRRRRKKQQQQQEAGWDSPQAAAHKQPWYLGFKASSSPGSPFARAARYGFTGSITLEKLERPQTTQRLDSWRPGFLRAASPVNEYGPQLRGSPQNPWSSPKTWPANACTTDGRSTAESAIYNSQTTLGQREHAPCCRLARHLEREQTELQRLQRAATAQRRQRRQQDRTQRQLLPDLSASPMRLSRQKQQQRAAVAAASDPSKRVKFWNSFAVVSSNAESLVAGERARATRKQAERSAYYASKWSELHSLLDVMKKPCHAKPGKKDVRMLLDSLRATAYENPHIHISRDQFVRLVVHAYDSVAVRCVHRIFTTFDLARTDRVDYRELAGTIYVLRFPGEPAAMLRTLFDIFQGFDGQEDSVSYADVRTMLTLFVASDIELRGMLRKFEIAFERWTAKGDDARIQREEFDEVLDTDEAVVERFAMTVQARVDKM